MIYITVSVEDEAGARDEVLVDRETAPRIGDWFEDEGRKLRRVPDLPNVAVRKYEFRYLGAPFKENIAKSGMVAPEHYDADGVAAFSTRRGVEEYMAKVNDSPADGVNIERA